MPNLSIMDVPESWAEALRIRAASNHRSLQGELMAMIERSLAEPPSPAPGVEPARRGVASLLAESPQTIDADRRAAELPIAAGLPRPLAIQGRQSVDALIAQLRVTAPRATPVRRTSTLIIRQDRDRR